MQKKDIEVPFEELTQKLDNLFAAKDERQLYGSVIEAIEKPLIEKVLERTFGNQYRAARILGINRNTLHSKIKKLKIDITRFKQY